MIPTMPIASMLELPELTLTGCDGGIEIVLLCSLPEEDSERVADTELPVVAPGGGPAG